MCATHKRKPRTVPGEGHGARSSAPANHHRARGAIQLGEGVLLVLTQDDLLSGQQMFQRSGNVHAASLGKPLS